MVHSDAFLDRPIARVLAALILALSVAALLTIHWERLFPPEITAEEVDPNDPFAVCFAKAQADINGMVADGLVPQAQAALFVTRAEGRCRAQTGQ